MPTQSVKKKQRGRGRKKFQQVPQVQLLPNYENHELDHCLGHLVECPELERSKDEYLGLVDRSGFDMNSPIGLVVTASAASQFVQSIGNFDALIQGIKMYKFERGEHVYLQGALAHFYFVVSKGHFKMTMKSDEDASGDAATEITCLGDYFAGSQFGDVSLVSATARQYSVTAEGDENLLLGIDRKSFRDLVRDCSNSNLSENFKFLRNIPLFKELNEEQITTLSSSLTQKNFDTDEQIMREGDDGDVLYVIKAGQVSISIGRRHIRNWEKGSYFGERALLYDEPRSATVTATKPTICLALNRDILDRVIGNLAQVLSRNIIVHALHADPFYKKFPKAQLEQLVETMAQCSRSFPPRANIILPNTAHDIRYIVVTDGEIEVRETPIAEKLIGAPTRFKSIYHENEVDGVVTPRIKEEKVQIVKRQGSFGTMYMADQNKRWTHRVRTLGCARTSVSFITTTGLFCCLGSDNYDQVLELTNRKKIMKSMYIFQFLNDFDFDQLASDFKVQSFKQGDHIITAGGTGEDADKFYIVKDGEVTFKLPNGTVIRTSGALSSFGERALILDEPRSATVITNSKECSCWYISKDKFVSVLKKTPQMLAHLREKFKLQDFSLKFSSLKITSLCGKGGFGTVFRCTMLNEEDERAFALKRISKRHLLFTNSHTLAVAEAEIMTGLDHPFVIKQVQCWKDNTYLYILLELISGGELTHAIKHMWGTSGIAGTRLISKHAKFYFASILVAMEYLHKQNVVWRDMKPENIMLDQYGFIKLIDFGCAKKLTTNKTYTVCGTPTYCAPEVISGSGYNKSCDLWTMGMVLYEMSVGRLPFGLACVDSDEEEDEEPDLSAVYGPIFSARLEFPEHNPAADDTPEEEFQCHHEYYHGDDDCEHLIRGLLTRVPGMRLGCGYRGLAQIRKHQWLDSFDWDSLMSRSYADIPYKKEGVYAAADYYSEDNWMAELEEEDDELGNNLPVTKSWVEGEYAQYYGAYNPDWDKSFKDKD